MSLQSGVHLWDDEDSGHEISEGEDPLRAFLAPTAAASALLATADDEVPDEWDAEED